MKAEDWMMGSQYAPHTEAVKFKGIALAITSSFSVSKSIWIGDADMRGHMVSKALSNIDESVGSYVMR